ncbi:MAG TPA: rhomboid family intramembrane serine protease [Candidatus Krumholzibacteria bacterium]|nr:rhomboid family intramembrane serine protease [Candidatus Krumholzibacteria bacterium]HPD71354.1 rhomboid family intramembrane serine protease [Candidatus Krumholzibacteria bacterium]HRY38946.1 rhomboid family intramembrane serine protease [Candidatus Krumholzibacteria bacterium]
MYFCYFFPVGLDLPRTRRPWLSGGLIAVILAAFAWQRWFPDRLALHPWELVFYVGGGRPWTALTAVFLHGGWLHLAGNLVYLITFLPALEDRLGRGRLLLLVMMAGVGGNLVHGVAAWQGWSGQGGLGIVGASGAISGLLGYALVRIPHARVAIAYWLFAPLQGQNRAGRARLALPVAILFWLLQQIVNSLVAGYAGSQVSYPAHFGGFATGVLLAVAMGAVAEGRADARLAQARRYLESGQAMAAAGAFSEYLACVPDDLAASIERARALAMAGVRNPAAEVYRQTFRAAVAAGRWDLALEALAEGRRCLGGLSVTVDELVTAAHRADKAGRRDLAVDLYQDLALYGGDHPARQRAWVRLVVLLHADPACREGARAWLERAERELPAGAWRDYLMREFSRPPTTGAALAAGPAGTPAGPAA